MIATFSSCKNQSIGELMQALSESRSAQPYNSKHIKMHDFIVNQYCNNFQTGKCRFGEKCKFKHEIIPDFKKKEIIVDHRKKKYIITNKHKNKIPIKKKNSNTSTFHNNIAGPPRGKQVEGQPPKYSDQQINAIRFINRNGMSEDQSTNNNNSDWLFSKTSNTADSNPRMHVNQVDLINNDDFERDLEFSGWKYTNYSHKDDDEEFEFEDIQRHQSDLIIHEFLKNNVDGKINYDVDRFLIRTSYGYASSPGVFSIKYQLNILGWNKLKMNEPEPFSEVFCSYNHHLMNLMYTLGKTWLHSFVQLPHASSYIQGVKNTNFADDAFMNFALDMKTYHLPDSGGSYLSRFHNDTSHILLTMATESITHYTSIYITVILLDFMAYASYNISMLYHNNSETEIKARKIFKKRIIKAAQKYSTKFRYINIFNAIIDDVFIMPNVDHHDDAI